jgi:hypothetical protein
MSLAAVYCCELTDVIMTVIVHNQHVGKNLTLRSSECSGLQVSHHDISIQLSIPADVIHYRKQLTAQDNSSRFGAEKDIRHFDYYCICFGNRGCVVSKCAA